MTTCLAIQASFVGALAGGPLLNDQFRCRVETCNKLVAEHPITPPITEGNCIITYYIITCL